MSGGGATGEVMRGVDWAATPLGPPKSWPGPLKTLISVMLGSRQPMFVAWGATRTMLYNDAYSAICGARHPAAMGAPFATVWFDIIDEAGPILERAFAGEATHMDDIAFVLHRNGYPEEAHFAFSYTPVRGDSGRVEGVFCACSETTATAMAGRQAATERERQRLMLRQMPGFVALLSGPEHRYQYVNEAYVEIAGQREFIGRTVREVFPEIADQGIYELLDKVYRTGEPFAARAMPVSLDRPDGERSVDLLFEPVRDDAGRVAGIFVGGYDVTDRVRAESALRASETALRRSETRYRSFLEASAQVVWRMSAAGEVDEPIPHWERYTGQDTAATLGVGWMDAIWSADRRAVAEAWRGAVASGTTYEVEYDLRRADGAWRRVVARGVPVRDETGAVLEWIGTCIDVTERRAAEEQARSQARIAEMVASGAPLGDTLDALMLLIEAREPDVRCGVLVVSEDGAHFRRGGGPSLPEAFHVALDGVASTPPYLGSCGEAAHEGRAVVVPDIAREDRYSAAWRKLMLSCGLRAVRSTPICGPDGRVLGVFAIYFPRPGDPTPRDPGLVETATSLAGIAIARWRTEAELRASESALRQWNEELEARVAREVAAREEVQARLSQVRRVEALGQLAGGIAHDFNNVLQAVQGGARLIQGQSADSSRVQRLAGMVADAAARGAAITRRLLSFARRGDIRAEPVDVADLLTGMREILAHTLGGGLEVRVQLPPYVPPMLADKGQLETVLINLATNARDAMAGRGTITLSAVAEMVKADAVAVAHPPALRPGAYVRLSVSDTGEGMDALTLARVGEPFFTTKALGKGTGLGLAMARGFAEQSGGALAIESAAGAGTTVRLWFPVADLVGSPVAPGWGNEALPANSPRRACVMVVDDEALVREITVESLAAAGFGTVSVGSGPEALELLDAGTTVDVLVSDLSMPRMDGVALIRETQRRRPGLPAILLTGFATDMAELAVGGAISGSFSLLRKPIDTHALVDRISVLLEGGR
ncbi:PAS domain-containing protein [Falsiroseomonas sp. HW251]|uniref:PAS domain-containing protein n=1 Tax=Falsiroseomonas sp. HW251 TaxID=3390998 RepID=UPI003D315476